MSKEINQIGIRGRVTEVVVRGEGETNGRKWTRYQVTLDSVPHAGRKKDEDGRLKFTTFDEVKVGQLIGQVCRATGWEKEYNKDGKVATFLNVDLSAVGRPKVIEDVQSAAPAPAAPEPEPAPAAAGKSDDSEWGWED